MDEYLHMDSGISCLSILHMRELLDFFHEDFLILKISFRAHLYEID